MRKTIVFFHAFPFSSAMWEEQIRVLSRDHTCVGIDLPGFGKTPLPDHPFTFEYYVDYVHGVLEEKGIKKSVWCGLSMGGYLALRLFQLYPELCEGLILCDTKSTQDGNESMIKRWGAIKSVRADREKFDGFQWKNLTSEESKKDLELEKRVLALVKQNSSEAIMNGVVAIATRTDTTPILEKIKVPTLIIVGEEDQLTPLNDAKFLHHQIGQSSLWTIPDVGHLSNLENPKSFNEALLNFMKALP